MGHWTLCDGKTNWNHENKCFHVQASLSSHWKSTNNEIMQFSYFYWKSNEKNDLISRWNLPWLRYCVMFLEKCIMAYYSIVVWLWPLYGFSQVNPFVEETGLSLEKKNIFMPIKHHFGKSEWLKINLTKTMHSFCHIVFRKAYISYIMINLNCNRGSVWLCPSTQQRNYDYFALVESNLQ